MKGIKTSIKTLEKELVQIKTPYTSKHIFNLMLYFL